MLSALDYGELESGEVEWNAEAQEQEEGPEDRNREKLRLCNTATPATPMKLNPECPPRQLSFNWLRHGLLLLLLRVTDGRREQ